MVTAVELCWIVSEETLRSYESTMNYVRILRDYGLLTPSQRGRGAAPLGLPEAALLSLAVLSSDLAKDAADVIMDTRQFTPASREVQLISAAIPTEAMLRSGAHAVLDTTDIVQALECTMVRLAQSTFFVSGDEIPPEGEYLSIQTTSVFFGGRYRMSAASIEAGNNGFYHIKRGFSSESHQQNEVEVRMRSSEPAIRGARRTDSFGLQTIERIARLVAKAPSGSPPPSRGAPPVKQRKTKPPRKS